MKLSLYLDEDTIARALIAGLRARGADVQTVGCAKNEIGRGNAESSTVLIGALNEIGFAAHVDTRMAGQGLTTESMNCFTTCDMTPPILRFRL